MTTVVLRNVKGSPLTYVEMDANFNNLNTAKLETGTPGTNIANTPAGTISAVTVQAAINELDGDIQLKASIASPTFTGTVSGITKSMVDLGNVDNTSDVNKPVSTAQQTAINAVGIPSGTIVPYAGNTIPTGYLLCGNGPSTTLIASYPTLFAAIGTLWGGNGTTTFGIPYFVTGGVPIHTVASTGVVGTQSTGQVISHHHAIDTYHTGAIGGAGRPQEGTTGTVASTLTADTGGTNNLPAGSYCKYMVKI